MRRFGTFDAWYAARSARETPAVDALRTLVARVAPTLVEGAKWGNGCWLAGHLPLLFLHAAGDHLQFGFFAGAQLADPSGVLRGSAKYVRHVRIESADDIDEAALETLIREAVAAPPYR